MGLSFVAEKVFNDHYKNSALGYLDIKLFVLEVKKYAIHLLSKRHTSWNSKILGVKKLIKSTKPVLH